MSVLCEWYNQISTWVTRLGRCSSSGAFAWVFLLYPSMEQNEEFTCLIDRICIFVEWVSGNQNIICLSTESCTELQMQSNYPSCSWTLHMPQSVCIPSIFLSNHREQSGSHSSLFFVLCLRPWKDSACTGVSDVSFVTSWSLRLCHVDHFVGRM